MKVLFSIPLLALLGIGACAGPQHTSGDTTARTLDQVQQYLRDRGWKVTDVPSELEEPGVLVQRTSQGSYDFRGRLNDCGISTAPSPTTQKAALPTTDVALVTDVRAGAKILGMRPGASLAQTKHITVTPRSLEVWSIGQPALRQAIIANRQAFKSVCEGLYRQAGYEVILTALVATSLRIELIDESRGGVQVQEDDAHLGKVFGLDASARYSSKGNGTFDVSNARLVFGFKSIPAAEVLPDAAAHLKLAPNPLHVRFAGNPRHPVGLTNDGTAGLVWRLVDENAVLGVVLFPEPPEHREGTINPLGWEGRTADQIAFYPANVSDVLANKQLIQRNNDLVFEYSREPGPDPSSPSRERLHVIVDLDVPVERHSSLDDFDGHEGPFYFLLATNEARAGRFRKAFDWLEQAISKEPRIAKWGSSRVFAATLALQDPAIARADLVRRLVFNEPAPNGISSEWAILQALVVSVRDDRKPDLTSRQLQSVVNNRAWSLSAQAVALRSQTGDRREPWLIPRDSNGGQMKVTGSVVQVDGNSITLDRGITLTIDVNTEIVGAPGDGSKPEERIRPGERIRATYDGSTSRANKIEIVNVGKGER